MCYLRVNPPLGSFGHYPEVLLRGPAGETPANVRDLWLGHLHSHMKPRRRMSEDYPELGACLKAALHINFKRILRNSSSDIPEANLYISRMFLTILLPGESVKSEPLNAAAVALVTVLDGITESLMGLWEIVDDDEDDGGGGGGGGGGLGGVWMRRWKENSKGRKIKKTRDDPSSLSALLEDEKEQKQNQQSHYTLVLQPSLQSACCRVYFIWISAVQSYFQSLTEAVAEPQLSLCECTSYRKLTRCYIQGDTVWLLAYRA